MASIQFLGAVAIGVHAHLLGAFQLRRNLPAALLERCHLIGEANKLLAQFVVLLKGNRAAQTSPALLKQLIFFRLLGLAAHNAQSSFNANQLFAHRHKMPLRQIQLARGLMLARTKSRHARGFLQNSSPLNGLGAQHGVNFALFNDAIRVVANARVKKQFTDVAQSNLLGVHQIFTAAIGPKPALHLHFIAVHGQHAVAHGLAANHFAVHGLVAKFLGFNKFRRCF